MGLLKRIVRKQSITHLGLSISSVCVCVCVCVCVFPSAHREGLICLDQLKCQGKDQGSCDEEVSFLCQVPSSHFILFTH